MILPEAKLQHTENKVFIRLYIHNSMNSRCEFNLISNSQGVWKCCWCVVMALPPLQRWAHKHAGPTGQQSLKSCVHRWADNISLRNSKLSLILYHLVKTEGTTQTLPKTCSCYICPQKTRSSALAGFDWRSCSFIPVKMSENQTWCLYQICDFICQEWWV